ncbi:MAG TPA: dienelactone hydrolase family protein [Candidatus Polarisedimenticolia bacterium]|nr:dienelactone hydrolase family protein [Candidatus Polarisedimenticolia bacterium]
MNAIRLALASLLVLFLATPATAATGYKAPKVKTAHRGHGNMLRTSQDGVPLVGYLSLPKGSGTHPGIVVIQEWWGLNDWVQQQADSLAARGYVAFAPDLYKGKVAYDEATAHQLMSGLVEDEAIKTLRASADFLRTRQDVRAQAIGVIGWCLGGRYAIRLAAADPGIRACVAYYGAPITDPRAIQGFQAAILGNFGAEDQGPSPDQVREFEAALKKAGKKVDFKIYPGAPHAFANANNPWGGYRPAAAKDAWARTVAFLNRELKQPSIPRSR